MFKRIDWELAAVCWIPQSVAVFWHKVSVVRGAIGAMAWAKASWTPGLDNPLIHRGLGGRLCDQARLLVGNLLWHVRRSETLPAHIVETMSASAAGDEVHLARTASAIGDRRGGRPRGVESPCCTFAWVV